MVYRVSLILEDGYELYDVMQFSTRIKAEEYGQNELNSYRNRRIKAGFTYFTKRFKVISYKVFGV